MADNTQVASGSGDVVRDKDRSGVKTQIVGIDVGIGGTESLMSATAPMPVYGPDVTATGTISTTDIVVAAPGGAGALVTGASTAGSLVALASGGGDSAWNIMIKSLTSGTLYFEGSLNSTNGTDGDWIAVNGRQTGVINTTLGNSATSNGIWRGNTSGLTWFRVRSVGALTGTPAITIRISDGTGAIFLNASIPTGANTIGGTYLAGAATATETGVAASASSGTLLASNTARKGAAITNDSTSATLYVRLSATAASNASGGYTVVLPAGAYYEVPGNYTGQITGIWTAATGFANVTELT